MNLLLKIILVIACGVFGCTVFVYPMSNPNSEQRAVDILVLWVSGLIASCAGLILWVF
jgi:hypothetical protein